MKKFGLMLAAMMLVSLKASAQPIPAKDGNYCMEDLLQYIQQKFHSIDGIDHIVKISASSGDNWYYYITMKFCAGNIVLDMNAVPGGDCTNPQYGAHTQFLSRVYATYGCQKYIPEDEFPDLYNN